MQLSDFRYHLPEELIARFPAPRRSASRLLSLDVDSARVMHGHFTDLTSFLNPGDLLVFNDTRVIPGRLYGHKSTGGKVEILLERVVDDNQVIAQLRASKSPQAGSVIHIDTESGGAGIEVEVTGREDDFFRLRFPAGLDLMPLLERIGHMPLPPYIDRQDEAMDRERYQTVYARSAGAVAAPTAGLHFDEALLAMLAARGVESCFLTLHVGAGTFQPVRTERIQAHRMHRELIDVGEQVCSAVEACRSRGGRVVAVGTTSVRSLETAALDGKLTPYRGETDIFIYPGFNFRVVDAMITNFHLPESTLLMLVSAFCGDIKMLLDAYNEAIEKRYRFFSYGDAMFLYHGSR